MSVNTNMAPGNHYYPIEDVETACTMLDRGYSDEQILKRIFDEARPFYSGRDADLRRTSKRLLEAVKADRERWNPHFDQVAMDLAFYGNRDAWENLTFYERREVIVRLLETYDTKRFHPGWPEMELDEGFRAWARAVGESPDRINSLRARRRNG